MNFTEAWEDTCSAVGLAARTGDVKKLKSLISENASVDISDNRGWKPLHEAAASSGLQCLRILLEHPKTNVNWVTHEGETALLLACKRRTKNVKEAVTLLLRHEAQPNITDNDLESPILIATKKGDLPLVNLLISSNADVNTQDCSLWSAIHEAAKSDSKLDILKALLAADGKLNLQDECGMTPIFVAAQHGQIECLRFLLKMTKCCPDVVNLGAEDNATPLMLAAQQGFIKCIQLLLSYGANPNLCAVDGATALHSAVQGKHPECLKLLLEAMELDTMINSCHPHMMTIDNPNFISPIHLAIDWESYDCLRLLLEAKFSPDSVKPRHAPSFPNLNKMPALSYAVLHNNIESARILLDAGATPDAPVVTAIHPLINPIFYGNLDMIDFLLEKGSNVNYYTPSEKHILMLILGSSYWQRISMKFLLSGSNPRLCFQNLPEDAVHFGNFLFSSPDAKLSAWKVSTLLRFTTIDHQIQHAYWLLEVVAKHMEKHDLEVWQRIKKVRENPSSLKHICRICLHNCMYAKYGSRLRTYIPMLPVPLRLQKYLLFNPKYEEREIINNIFMPKCEMTESDIEFSDGD